MAKKENQTQTKILPEDDTEKTLLNDGAQTEKASRLMAETVKNEVLQNVRSTEMIITQMVGSEKWKQDGYSPEVEAELREAFAQRGINEDVQAKIISEMERQIEAAGEPNVNLEMSPIFKSLGWLPVEQSVIENDVAFNFLSGLMPIKVVENGKVLKFYSDNTESDNVAGYKVPDTANEYYDTFLNENTALTTEEEWKTTLNIHKGILVPNISLNDFTSKEAIFLALFDNYTKQVSTPINRAIYRLRLLILQDPDKMENVDWTKLIIDKEITGSTVVEAWEELKNFLNSLTQPSRQNQPERYIPKGFTKPLEVVYNHKKDTLVIPNSLKNYLELQVRAGLFNQKFVDIEPSIQSLDYKKSFVEYTKSTNVKDDVNDCVLFLIPQSAVEIIQHYEATRGQDLLVLFYVSHIFIRLGRAINKKTPILNIHFSVKETEPKTKAE